MSITRGTSISAALLLAACCHLTPALADTLSCDDGIKTAFRPDADTSVIAVRLVKKGEELKAPDAQQPITAAADLCLVKLLVGPGHRYADKIGSKVPAIVNANIGYASGTTDAGQPWYQDGSFAFLSDGKV